MKALDRKLTRDLWSTLGGHSLRDRLLARCLAIYHRDFASDGRAPEPAQRSPGTDVLAVLARLPLEERAAVALVDRVGLSCATGAAVMAVTVVEFRAFLHSARDVLMTETITREDGTDVSTPRLGT